VIAFALEDGFVKNEEHRLLPKPDSRLPAPLATLRRKMYNILREDGRKIKKRRIFDMTLMALILVSLVFIILDTFMMPAWYRTLSHWVELVSVVLFTIEYIARVWTAPLMYPTLTSLRAYCKYIFSFIALIDLLSILPFYLPFVFPVDLRVLRSLRIIRLLRVFKIGRYTSALTVIGQVFRKKAHQLMSSLLVLFMLMTIAAVMMYNVESVAQPDKFTNVFSALWWAVSTITTVGYGDLYPITVVGQLLGMIISFLGIALVAVPTGIISAGFVEAINMEEGGKKKENEKHYCPYCGHNLTE
jgi:voltage-gated potassium channel